MYAIHFFQTPDGTSPVKDFILTLDPKMKTKVLRNLKHLQQHGPELREPYSKPLGDGIFELRTQFGGNIVRVLYFFYYHGTIVVTNGFVKKTQKTPPREIERAKKYRAAFLKEKERR